MNKKIFIKNLKEKLSILDNEEVKDIISEYTDIIDEKIKNGETEEDAIKDFGDINELAKEILKAYKVNSKYVDENNTKISEDFEGLIKKGANKLSSFTKEVVDNIKENDNEFTLDKIFEIILKAIALLFICAILRIPFMLITGLGEMILNVTFFPIDNILGFFWHVIIWIVYIITCILIGIAMFKGYFNNFDSKKKESKSKKVEPQKNNEQKKESVEEKTNSEVIKKEVVVKNNSKNDYHPVLDAILLTIRILVTIFLTVPLIFINIGLGIATFILIYYLCIGINLIGPILLLIGLSVFFQFLTSISINIFTNKMKHFIAPIIVSFVFVVVGGLVTFEQARHYEYFDNLDHEVLEIVEENKTIQLEDENYYFELSPHDILTKNVDQNMIDGEVKFEFIYCPDVIKINIIEDNNLSNTIYTSRNFQNSRLFWTIYDDVIEQLKNKKVYDYIDIYKVKINVYANEFTLRQIKNNS